MPSKTITISAESKITLSALAILLSTLVGAIWWASAINSGVSQNTKAINDLTDTIQAMGQGHLKNTNDIESLKVMHASLEKRMDGFEKKQVQNTEILIELRTILKLVHENTGNMPRE